MCVSPDPFNSIIYTNQMNFNNSLFKPILHFNRIFIRLKHDTCITRQQLLFLSFLVETDHIKAFTVRSILVKGLTWPNANAYLNRLKLVGYVSKQGRVWSITDSGMQFYQKFMKEINRANRAEFRWK